MDPSNYRLVSIEELDQAIQEGSNALIVTPEYLYSIREWLLRCRELASQLLWARMKDLCQKYLQQSWIDRFEYELWRAVVDGPEKVTEAEVTELDRLSTEAGGWWTWSEDEKEPLFLTQDEWQSLYAKRPDPNQSLRSQNEQLQERIRELENELSRGSPE